MTAAQHTLEAPTVKRKGKERGKGREGRGQEENRRRKKEKKKTLTFIPFVQPRVQLLSTE